MTGPRKPFADSGPGRRGLFRGSPEEGGDDTIAAVATPAGVGGISIVRLSGPQACSICDRFIKLRKSGQMMGEQPWSAALGYAVDPEDGSVVDEVIVLFMRGPRSYTGEDVVEIQCHGGALASEKILSLAFSAGAVAAEAGEFTKRAFLSGRITLDQAEAVFDLVHAPGEASLRDAAKRLKGELGEKISAWEAGLLGVLAPLVGGVDFPEDVGLNADEPLADLADILHEVKGLLAHAPLGIALARGIEVCLVGRPNVGKSSLFNALLGRKRAIVTDIPGTTRDVLRERCEWAGLPVTLLDTAGLRETEEIVEMLGVKGATSAALGAEVILYVVDGALGLDPEDVSWLSSWKDKKVVVVANKADLGPSRVLLEDVRRLNAEYVSTSGASGLGLDQLKAKVAAYYAGSGVPEGAIPGSARQIDCLSRAVRFMEEALDRWKSGWTLDVIIQSVEEALGALAELTGKKVSASVLDEIFARFCVGK